MEVFEWTLNYHNPTEEGYYFVSIDPYYLPPDIDPVDCAYWYKNKWWCYNCDKEEEYPIKEAPILAYAPFPKPYVIWDDETERYLKP